MGPSERRNLLKMIHRVGRHRGTAHVLYRNATKYPIVRAMGVVLVSLPGREVWKRPLATDGYGVPDTIFSWAARLLGAVKPSIS